MKIVFAFACILLLSTLQVSAKTLEFPDKGDAMFQITIPDSWQPDQDDDDVVEATSPKDHVSLAIWEIKTEEELKNLDDDIEEILADHAKEIKLVGKPKEISPAGMEGLLFEGTAVADDDDHKIEFFTLFLISKSTKKVAVVFIEADADTPKKELDKLVGILKSIQEPAKE
jgi:hypothetical protein